MSDGTVHATLSPSSKERWGKCAGSPAMEDGIPNDDTEFSAEGTAAHILASRVLDSDDPNRMAEFFRDAQIQVGERVYTVDDDLISYVQVYADEVRSRATGKNLMVEQRLDMSEVYGVPDQFGTGDAVIVDYEKRHLTVIDLKYGQGVKVFAEMNEQMMSYGAGAIYTLLLDGEIDNVTLVISQPRLHHMDEWTISAESLAGWVYTAKLEAAKAMKLLMQKRAGTITQEELELNLTPGESQCRWCKVKAVCNKLSRHISAEVMQAFDAIDSGAAIGMSAPTVPDDNESLGRKASSVALIYDWCGAVLAELNRRVLSGQTIIGSDGLAFKTVEGKGGNRAWIDPAEAEAKLLEVIGDKAYAPREIITPSVADKQLNKKKTKATWELLTPLIRKPPGKVTVVPGSDPRPAYSGAARDDEFAEILPPDPLSQ